MSINLGSNPEIGTPPTNDQITQIKTSLDLGNVPNIDTRNRSNHTGTQPISSISQLESILDIKLEIDDLSNTTTYYDTAPDSSSDYSYQIQFNETHMRADVLSTLAFVNNGSYIVTLTGSNDYFSTLLTGASGIQFQASVADDGASYYIDMGCISDYITNGFYFDQWYGNTYGDSFENTVFENSGSEGSYANVDVELYLSAYNYPGEAGKFASYGDGGIACCISGPNPPVWVNVDTDWLVERLPVSSIPINSVINLSSELVDKYSKQQEVDAKYGMIIRGDDNSRWRLSMRNGALTSVMLTDSLVTDYLDDTQINSTYALDIQGFVNVLTTNGLLSSLVDGMLLKSNYNTVNGTTLRSLRGVSNLTTIQNPTLGNCGMIFNGANQGAHAPLSLSSNKRTFFCLYSLGLSFQSPHTTEAFPWVLKNNYTYNEWSGESMRFSPLSTSGQFTVMADGGATQRTIGVTSSRNFPPKTYFSVYTYDGSLPAYSLSGTTFRNFGGSKLFGTTTKNTHTTSVNPSGDNIPTKLTLGGGGGDGIPITKWCETSIGNWLLFDKILSDGEISTVFNALSTMYPRWVYVAEGDSLMNFTTPRMFELPELFGTNVEVRNYAIGGYTVPQTVAGLSPSKFTGDNVVVDFLSIDNFSTSATTLTYPVSTYHSDIRTIWSYARTQNPNCKILGQTVTSSTTFALSGWMDELNQLNTLIRADEGVYYDVLVDTWQICEDLKRPEYTYQHDDPSVIVDGIHFSESAAQAIGRAKITAIESIGIRIR